MMPIQSKIDFCFAENGLSAIANEADCIVAIGELVIIRHG